MRLAALALSAAAILGVWSLGKAVIASANADLELTNLDLGPVWVNDQVRHTVTVRNVSHAEIQITDFLTNCGCVLVSPRAFVLAPGESEKITLEVDLRMTPDPQRASPFELSVVLLPIIDGRRQPFRASPWRLTAIVQSPIRPSSGVIDFGMFANDKHDQEPPDPLREVELSVDERVSQLIATPSVDFLDVSIKPARSKPHFYRLRVRTDGAVARALTSSVEVFPVLQDGTKLPPLTLPVTGRVLGDVRAIPAEIICGAIRVGDQVSRTLVLESASGSAFEALPEKHQSEGIAAAATGNSRKDRVSFRIDVEATRAGAVEETVSFDIKEIATGRESKIFVLITYYGVRPTDSDTP